MISAAPQITVQLTSERVVTLDVAGIQTQITVALDPAVQVVTSGYQGPVGTVADGVLGELMQVATAASQLAEQNRDDLTYLAQQLRATFDYQTGAIAAQ